MPDTDQVDAKQRDAVALRVLRKHKGKINNKDVADQVRQQLELPPTWELRGDFVNDLRKKYKLPLPPRGGFRVKNGVEATQPEKTAERIAMTTDRFNAAREREEEFQKVAVQFADLCERWNMARGEIRVEMGNVEKLEITPAATPITIDVPEKVTGFEPG